VWCGIFATTKSLKVQVPPNINPIGDPHDRLKVVCARDRDLARARGTVLRPPARFPCMGLFLSRGSPDRQIFCPSSVSLFDLQARFFVPTRGSLTSSRAGAVKVGRRANLAACSELARPYLDSFEHDGTLGAIGMTIRGEPAFGRGSVAPQPCIRWVQGPEP